MSQVKKGAAPKNSFVEWGLDKHKDNLVRTATYSSGVSDALPIDGEDISSSDFENYDDRTKCSIYLQYARRVPKVSRLANMTSDIAGVGYKKEMANSIAKALVAHKRDIEATLCSSQETAQETSSAPYQTRGLGKWISSSAQATLPVPTDFLTPTGSIGTSAAASATEEDLRDILQSIYEQTGESDKTFYGLCGTAVKKTISNFTLFTPRTNNLVVSNRDTDEGRLAASVDIIESDFGVITLNLSSFLEQDARSSGAYDPTVGQNTLFILNMAQLESAFAEETSVRELPDLGGGPRSIIESVFSLKSYSGGLDHGKYTLS
tara:strand:- start:12070 stop:13029 length:960 start_codon:yes stop_codon:yes gene_type:complete